MHKPSESQTKRRNSVKYTITTIFFSMVLVNDCFSWEKGYDDFWPKEIKADCTEYKAIKLLMDEHDITALEASMARQAVIEYERQYPKRKMVSHGTEGPT